MLTILIILLIILGIFLFMGGPTILDALIDAYDDWKEVLSRIRRRNNNGN